jgi:threonine/homoserine/homoserine lactone efflux protein
MADVLSTVSVWMCAVIAVLAIGWGVGVLVTGKAPRRGLRQYPSVSAYGWFFIGFGVVFVLFALGNALDGWFGLLTPAAFFLLVWLNIWSHRGRKRAREQRRTAARQTPTGPR